MRRFFPAFALTSAFLQFFFATAAFAKWGSPRELRPTQPTCGLWEVNKKKELLEEMSKKELSEYLEEEPVIVVLGPGDVAYVVDHHHLARAAIEAGIKEVKIKVRADYSKLSQPDFEARMRREGLAFLKRPGDKPIEFSDLPKTLLEMTDDPYRSLAWRVRKNGGYEKTTTLYADFYWAEFFRTRVKSWDTRKEFDKRVEEATKLAGTKAAKGLPGFSGECADRLEQVHQK